MCVCFSIYMCFLPNVHISMQKSPACSREEKREDRYCACRSFNKMDCQRGLSEAQNEYTFCMLLGYGPPNFQVSSLALKF